MHRTIAAFPVIVAILAADARAEVGAYYVETTPAGETRLVGLTARRGGSPVTFDAARLIPARVVHFKSPDPANLITPPGAVAPPAVKRALLLGDMLLNTGLINPGGQEKPLAAGPVLEGPGAAPGLGVRFAQPVVNLPGDDVAIFEFHRKPASPPAGDAFHVGPLRHAPGLRAATIERFDFDVDDPRARPIAFDLWRLDKAPGSLGDLETAAAARAGSNHDFKVLAVAIDLSSLGYAEGAKVEGLFIQDAPGTGLLVDPVLVAGLPAPAPENLLKAIPKDPSAPPAPGELLARLLAGKGDESNLRRSRPEGASHKLDSSPFPAGAEEIIFAMRVPGWDHWYANFGHYSAATPEYPPQRGIPGEEVPALYKDGGRLCRLNLRTGKLATLLDDPAGGVRDPQVHYDGQRILFSYRKGGQPYYHLYEINADGSGLKQITGGPFDDVEPTYLPDGVIMFCSSRSKRFVNCWRTPVAVLYRCDGDGGNLRPLSTNVEHDNTPWPLADGRVLYMRWEYVDRSQVAYHHLWTANPDGTGQMVYFGNQFPETAMLDAKPIPGTRRIVASFSPGHGRPEHMGHVTVVDPGLGPDHLPSARRASRSGVWRDPYPLSEDLFLVADDRGLWLMDGQGNTDPIYALEAGEKRLTCHEPRPLAARPREPVLAPRVDLSKATGRLVLADVYQGRNMAGVRRGEIKKLLVLEQLPKPVNFSGGMWPTSAGGTFTLSRVLGTVPVGPDGSADFEAPAMRSLFFVALDENDLAVKRMQSFVSLQPGETFGCVGCHEARTGTFPALGTVPFFAAIEPAVPSVATGEKGDCPPPRPLSRAPHKIEPVAGVPDVLDFPRDIQPALDRHCTACHNPDKPEGRVDLSGDHTPLFAQSYWTLLHHGLVSDGRNEPQGNRPPRSIGSSASRLLTLMDGSHYGAKPSEHERRVVRLWIESSAVYAGTYAALGSGMHPVEFPIEAMERRCGACHGHQPPKKQIGRGLYFRFGPQGPAVPLVHEFLDLQQIRGTIGYYKCGNARPPQSLCNLTRPEKSLLLRAPLAKAAGGLEWCGRPVFAGTDDADYQAILARIAAAARKHQEEKRFDMPGFRPNVYYVRAMKRYGVLAPDLDEDAPVDGYAADRKYWESFWHRP